MPSPRFTAVRLDDIPSLPAAGTLAWKPVRRALGIGAFGINAYVAAEAGDEVVEDHDELGLSAGRHEELYVVTTGHATFTVDGTVIDAPAGTLVFVAEPAARRHAFAVAPHTTVLAIGGTAGEAYRVAPWEFTFVAEAKMGQGAHDEALATMAEGLERYPDSPTLRYNLGCYLARLGRADEAVACIVEAMRHEPRVAEWAAGDSDLDPIRDHPAFPA